MVQAVVVDSTVPADHPTLMAARMLGIEVFKSSEAIDSLLSAVRSRRKTPPPQVSRSTP
jgi:hypothetical protein